MHLEIVHVTTEQGLHAEYQIRREIHTEHISIAVGQSEKFLVYKLISNAVFKLCHPGENEGLAALRYPHPKAPKNLEELFATCPIREDYDTASKAVAQYLVSASPSLLEDDRDESAVSIYRENDRDQIVEDVVCSIFDQEGVSKSIYAEKVEELLEERLSGKAGIVTQVFLPKAAPLDRVIYRARAYGLPYEGQTISEFFEGYQAGQTWEDDPIPQVRFLPSGVDFEGVHTICYTHLTESEFSALQKKVQNIVSAIFEANKTYIETLSAREKQALQSPEKDQILEGLVKEYLECSNPYKACELLDQMGDEGKAKCLPMVVLSFIQSEEYERAESMLSDAAEHQDKLLAQLALGYLDLGNFGKTQATLAKMNPSPQKNLVLLMSMQHFDALEDQLQSQISSKYPTDLEQLFELDVLELDSM